MALSIVAVAVNIFLRDKHFNRGPKKCKCAYVSDDKRRKWTEQANNLRTRFTQNTHAGEEEKEEEEK